MATETITPDIKFEGVVPILRVGDLKKSIEYYVTVLGFKLDWNYERVIASVSRGGCGLFLSQGDQGYPGSWVWIGVDDVERLFDEYRARGARVRHPPTNYAWALEMQIEDLDGNVLRIGSDNRIDQPIGEWLDMYGRRWVKSPEGGWMPAESSGSSTS
jgi:catechol 2,3-dioxygenase-like lactoylglutathione lyase family enzyme